MTQVSSGNAWLRNAAHIQGLLFSCSVPMVCCPCLMVKICAVLRVLDPLRKSRSHWTKVELRHRDEGWSLYSNASALFFLLPNDRVFPKQLAGSSLSPRRIAFTGCFTSFSSPT